MTQTFIIPGSLPTTASERIHRHAVLGMQVRRAVPMIDTDSERFANLFNASPNFPKLPPTLSDVQYRELILDLHFSGLWTQLGFNVFELPFDLAASLLLTTPASIEGEVHLPFDAFIITTPHGVIPFFTDKGQFWTETIRVHRYGARVSSIEQRDFVRVTCQAQGLDLWRHRYVDQFHDQTAEDEAFTSVFAGDPPKLPQDELTLMHAMRLVRNLLTWLDFTGGVKAQVRKHVSKKARRAAAKGDPAATAARVWIIGTDVKLSKELCDDVEAFALGNTRTPPVGWKVRVGHIVRGHWTTQAHGPGHTERRRQWIAPYHRGPDGVSMAHIYKPENKT